MPTLVIRSHASQGSSVPLDDLGYAISPSGGSVTLTDDDELEAASSSDDLRALATDGAHGAGPFDSTLILNDGTSDISKGNVDTFLATVSLPRIGPHSAVVRDASNTVSGLQVTDPTDGTHVIPRDWAAKNIGGHIVRDIDTNKTVDTDKTMIFHDTSLGDNVEVVLEDEAEILLL